MTESLVREPDANGKRNFGKEKRLSRTWAGLSLELAKPRVQALARL